MCLCVFLKKKKTNKTEQTTPPPPKTLLLQEIAQMIVGMCMPINPKSS